MTSKRYYWLKFPSDFFTSMRVRALEKASKTYLIIYLKMMTKAVTTEGIIYHRGVFDCIDDEIALDIGEDSEDVKNCTSLLKRYGLVSEFEEGYLLPWVKDSIGSETSSAERVRRHRALQCNTDVTQVSQKCNGDIEIDIEKEKERKKKKKKDELPTYDSSHNPPVDEERLEEVLKAREGRKCQR